MSEVVDNLTADLFGADVADVPVIEPNPLQTLGGTAGTAGTAENDNAEVQCCEPAQTNDPTAAPAGHWLIHFLDHDPVELYVSPALSHAEVLAQHPDAVAAEPIPERVTRPANLTERNELLALVSAIYAGDTDADRAEALDAALADPEGALQCYRAIASERGIVAALPKVAGEVAGSNAKSTTASCRSCRHRKQPGRADPGYCGGGRDDLLPAYGLDHPLRRLPDDLGASCASYSTFKD